jgi:hypothetical protein
MVAAAKSAPPKVKKVAAPPVAKVVAPPAPKPAPAPVGPISLIGGTKVDVNVKEDDVPRFMPVSSQASITLRVCNDTNTTKILESISTEGIKTKAHAKIVTSATTTDKKGQKSVGVSIGPQQSFPVSILVTTPDTASALPLTFAFKMQHRTVKCKVHIMVLEKLPERPVVAPVSLQYRPDQVERKIVPRPSQFQTIRVMEHVPHFENPENLFPLTPELRSRLELEKDIPLTSPPWIDRSTYKKRMHDILWMEEMEQQRLLRAFDLAKTFMARHEDPDCKDALLAMEVPSLSERRPTIAPGDSLYAWVEGSTDVEYEGYIYQVRQAVVIAAFDPEFHQKIWKKDLKFTVRFTTSRHQFLVHHTAVENVDLDVVWPDSSLSPLKPEKKIDITPSALADRNIEGNATQFNTVKLGLNSRTFDQNIPLLVFGPFGTGKTKTLVELVYQVFHNRPSSRILVCALSNSAADVLTQRLIATSIGKPSNLIRLYAHTRKPYQVSSEIHPFTFINLLGEFGIPSHTKLQNYRVVVSTCNNTAALFGTINAGHFTHIIVDEAAQLMEADALIPLSFATRQTSVVMAGDPKQLQFRSQSKAKALEILSLSIMERLHVLPQYVRLTKEGPRPNHEHWVHLNDNYRSHPAILRFASEQFYHGSLVAKADLSQLPPLGAWENISNVDHPMAFLPIEGVEQCEDDSPSFFNELEAQSVTLLIQDLLSDPCARNLKQTEIGVITPFFKQTKRIREMLRMVGCKDVQVSSIADLQGREFKALFVSTVRTSKKFLERDALQGLGFINSPNALNSVVTRSRALLVVVGDPFTVAQDESWNAFMATCLNNGTYWGEPLNPAQIAARQEQDERNFNAPLFVTPSSESRINKADITFTKQQSAVMQLLDETSDPFGAVLGSLGNPALASTNAVPSSSAPLRASSSDPSAAPSGIVGSNTASNGPSKRTGISAEHSNAAPYMPSAAAAPQHVLPRSLLRMDEQDFLLRVPGFDAPQVIIASSDSHLEAQIACLGYQPTAEKIANVIHITLQPIPPQGSLLWNSSSQVQKIDIVIPSFSVHFDYQVSSSAVRLVFQRGSTLTPQPLTDRYMQGRIRE